MQKLIRIINSAYFKWLVAILAFTILLHLVDFQGLMRSFEHVTLGGLVYFLYLSVVLIYISALKWQLFIEAKGERISAIRLSFLYILGYFVNLLVPSYLGGDAVRSWYAGEKVDRHNAFAATVMERYTGVVAMFVLALIFMWRVKLVTPEIRGAILLLFFVIVLSVVVGLQPRLIDWIEKKCPPFKKISKHCRKIQQALIEAHKQPILMLKAFGYSLLFHSVTVLNVIVAGYCIGWTDIPYQDLFVVLPLVLLVAFIPISPSGLGIQEGAYFYFLQGLGATSDQALAVALALRAKTYLLAVIGGFVWLFLSKTKTGSGEKKHFIN